MSLQGACGFESRPRHTWVELVGRYEEIYRRSLEEPEAFWAEAAQLLDWYEPWERVLDDSRAPIYRWFAGGRMNTCFNALDRHVDGGVAPTRRR